MSYEDHLPPSVRQSRGGSHARKSAGRSKMTRDEIRAMLDAAFEFTVANPKFRTPLILEGFAEEYRKLG